MKSFLGYSTALGLITLSLTLGSSLSALQAAAIGTEGRIWIEGTSTLRSFSCDVLEFEGVVQAKSGVRRLDLAGLGSAVRSLRVNVRPAAIDCRNGTMNAHMKKALKADANPQVTYNMTSYEVLPGEGDAQVRTQGQLTMAGQTKTVTMEATATPTGDGGIRIRGSHPVAMTEFGMTPPSLMLGTIKVGNRITVQYDVVVRP